MIPDIQCDVLVVGWGNAGSVAAITAHDNGANVLIIEKMAEGGGSTALSGGSICTPTSVKFADYLEALCYGTVDREMIDAFVRIAVNTPEFIRQIGGEASSGAPFAGHLYPTPVAGAGFPSVPGAEHMVKLQVKAKQPGGHQGARYWELLQNAVNKRKIRTMTSTRAVELVKNSRGEATGMIAEEAGKKIFIKARKAVILTTGGFDNDPGTLWHYCTAKPIKYLGCPGNTGDGIRILQKAGAALWHMGSIVTTTGFQAPGFEAAFPIYCSERDFIYVDKQGKRFAREAGEECHRFHDSVSFFDKTRMEFPAVPAYIIFGEKTLKANPLCLNTAGINFDLYKWSRDNSAEIKKGWIVKAVSIAELARKLSMESSTLQNTVDKFNAACKKGKDEEFGRPIDDMAAIAGPPFYALAVYPALFCTQGGGRRDKSARVLDPYGQPIPRLYEAGDLGGMMGWLYQGSIGLTDGIVFGQIAGKNAAAEKRLR